MWVVRRVNFPCVHQFPTFKHLRYKDNTPRLPSSSSVQSLDWLGCPRDMSDDSAEISFHFFFCRRPLWAVLACTDMSTLWCYPSSISTADHGFAHPPRCPEGWFWRACCGVWHAGAMQISVSWQLPEEVPVNPQGRLSCSAPSRWPCAPSKRSGEVLSCTWFWKPGSFLQS